MKMNMPHGSNNSECFNNDMCQVSVAVFEFDVDWVGASNSGIDTFCIHFVASLISM